MKSLFSFTFRVLPATTLPMMAADGILVTLPVLLLESSLSRLCDEDPLSDNDVLRRPRSLY